MVQEQEESIKSVFIEWVGETTSHGLPRIFKSKYKINKILWTFIFLAGVTSAAYFFTNTLITYYQFNPAVQVQLIREFPTTFPAVTICNLNPFPNINLSNQTEFFDKNYKTNIDAYFVNAQENTKRYVANFLTKEERIAAGFQLNSKTLISCSFNKRYCHSNNFSSFIDYDFGNCYTFNGGDLIPETTTLTGSNYGLTLEILTGDPTVQTILANNKGILLAVHNQTKTLVPSIQLQNGIYISPGTNSYLSINREIHSKLPAPYSNCLADLTSSKDISSVLYNYMIQTNISSYDQESCIRLCYQKSVQNNCYCYDSKYPPLDNMNKACSTARQVKCILEITSGVFLNRNDYINICGFDCPIECLTVDYILANSVALYPSSRYYVQVLDELNYLDNFDDKSNLQADIEKYLLRVTVNYNVLGYTLINEYPQYQPFDIIGNLGGQGGLFLGISALSIIEIFELVLDLYLFSRKKSLSSTKNSMLNFRLVIVLVICCIILIAAALIAPLTIYVENQHNSDYSNTQISLKPLITTSIPITVSIINASTTAAEPGSQLLINLNSLKCGMNIELNFVPSSLKKKRDIDITNLSCDEYKQKFRSSCNDLTSCNQTALQAFIYDYTQRNLQNQYIRTNDSAFEGLDSLSIDNIRSFEKNIKNDLIIFKFSTNLNLNYNKTIPNGYYSGFTRIQDLGQKSLDQCIFQSSKVLIASVLSPVKRSPIVQLITGNEKIQSKDSTCSMNQFLFELSCSNIIELAYCKKNELTLFLKYYVIQSVNKIASFYLAPYGLKNIEIDNITNIQTGTSFVQFKISITFNFVPSISRTDISTNIIDFTLQNSLLNCQNIFTSVTVDGVVITTTHVAVTSGFDYVYTTLFHYKKYLP